MVEYVRYFNGCLDQNTYIYAQLALALGPGRTDLQLLVDSLHLGVRSQVDISCSRIGVILGRLLLG